MPARDGVLECVRGFDVYACVHLCRLMQDPPCVLHKEASCSFDTVNGAVKIHTPILDPLGDNFATLSSPDQSAHPNKICRRAARSLTGRR